MALNMDYYKFGNALCSLREEKGMTQKELAQILDVSDKAVSKWENGQAIPRINVLEKIAEVFDTSVEDLISNGKSNVKRIYIHNNYGSVIHVKSKETVTSITADDCKWIEIPQTTNEYELTVYGELDLNDIYNDLPESPSDKPKSLKERIIDKGISKWLKHLSNFIDRNVIQTKCTYRLSDILSDCKISVDLESFSIGDRMWILDNICISYPKLICDGCNRILINAVCINNTQIMKSFKKSALTSELGISIPFMLFAYPIRKMYFKSVLKPKGLMKFINKADYYIEKEKESNKKWARTKHPIIKSFFIIIFAIIALIAMNVGFGILNVEIDKPVLVSADLSQIKFYREDYIRIDALPYDAMPDKIAGAEIWHDARTEGLSKTDQYLEDNKATVYIDSQGNKYLWLVLNYTDTILGDDGYREYADFEEPLCYKQVKE
ncbi:MAG: helix-turn-helix transcriptional regulator [Oscillospiraceae bacterium]|nr:helix-turn-helix transcriptional regulator [Oscillospiraceae bacterium]